MAAEGIEAIVAAAGQAGIAREELLRLPRRRQDGRGV